MSELLIGLFRIERKRMFCRWLVLVVLLCFGGHAISAQPIDLRINRDAAVEDYDFAWVYWFETHGRGYVREALGGRPLPWDTPASRRWRGEAVSALKQLMTDEADAVRAAAALALARLGEEAVRDAVLPGDAVVVDEQGEAAAGLLLDASPEVRLSAWMALGLMDDASSRAALAAPPIEAGDEQALVAQAVGIGLLGSLDGVHARWLAARLADPRASAEVKRWCLWALNRHDDPAYERAYGAALTRLPSTFVVSEVLMNRAYAQRRGGALWLMDVLRYHPDVRGWAGYRGLSAVPVSGVYGSTPRRLAMETRVAAALSLADQPIPTRGEDQQDVLGQLRLRIVAGNSAQAMDFNRGYDLIAYAMQCDASAEDLALLYDQMRGLTRLPEDDPAVVEAREAGTAAEEAAQVVPQRFNAVRGHAALAGGLLIRRATEGTALQQDRPLVGREAIDIERLKRRFGLRLMRAVANEREPVSYRSACALAIGLTGDPRYVGELTEELGRLQAGDEAVLGYGLLALAMLGEERAAEPARRYLNRPGAVGNDDDRLGRRAALQAIGLIGEAGGDDTAQALAGAWGRDPWVSLDIAGATAWSGRYEALPMILASTKSESPAWRQAAAVALGRVFDRDATPRLNRLIEQTNPTLSYRPLQSATERGSEPADESDVDAGDPFALPGWPMREPGRLAEPGLYRLLWR